MIGTFRSNISGGPIILVSRKHLPKLLPENKNYYLAMGPEYLNIESSGSRSPNDIYFLGEVL